jgi:hypothetical protein
MEDFSYPFYSMAKVYMGFGGQGKRETTLLEVVCLDLAEKTKNFPFINDACCSGIPFPQGCRESTCIPD